MAKPRTHAGQLDLFLHSGAVMLANDVLDALLARDRGRAMKNLHRLRAEDADYRQLGDLQTLCDVLRDWPFPGSDAAEVAQAVRTLAHTVQPAARHALGNRSVDFMRPFWSELASVVRPFRYDPAWPEAYRAGLLIRAGEYTAAEQAAASIPHAEDHPDAWHWLAVARHRSQGLEASRSALFRLALLAPERFGSGHRRNRRWDAAEGLGRLLGGMRLARSKGPGRGRLVSRLVAAGTSRDAHRSRCDRTRGYAGERCVRVDPSPAGIGDTRLQPNLGCRAQPVAGPRTGPVRVFHDTPPQRRLLKTGADRESPAASAARSFGIPTPLFQLRHQQIPVVPLDFDHPFLQRAAAAAPGFQFPGQLFQRSFGQR